MLEDQKFQRINERLTQYWFNLKGDHIYPHEHDIDLGDLSDVWDNCFLVKHDEQSASGFVYVYLGSHLIQAYGDDLNEREICERLAFPSSVAMVHKFDAVVEAKAPVNDEGEFVNTKGVRVLHRSVMLPLASKRSDSEIGFILGGMRWKSCL